MNKLMLEKEKYKVIKGRFCCAGLVIPRFVSGVRCQGISNHIAHALLLLSLLVSQFIYLMRLVSLYAFSFFILLETLLILSSFFQQFFSFFKGSKNFDPNDPKYADELEREVGLFQKRLRILKEHLEMITCFDMKKQRQSTLI